MSIVDAARDAASRLLMLDRCEITRQDGQVFNPATGTYDVFEIEVATDLPCNLTPFTGVGDLTLNFGGEAVNTRNYRLTVPWDAPRIKEEDTVRVIVSRDPRVSSREYRVVGVQHETFQTARRVVLEEIRMSESDDDESGES